MSAEFLRNLWYFALPARALRKKQLVHKLLLGEPVLFGRTEAGEAFALRDICPHRGVPLTAGRILEGTVECPYHGWRFKPSGQCTFIPSLVGEEGVDAAKIRVRSYPVIERNGLIWIYMPQDPAIEATLAADIPVLPIAANAMPRMIEAQMFPCEIDHAVMGLMDPAHGPFVHKAWWWRSASSIHAKAKKYGPIPHGFTMISHKPSSNSFLYKVLGGDVSTEISFELPSVRIEHIKAGRHEIVGLTTCTPVTELETEVTQTFFWTMKWVAPFKPLFRQAAVAFMNQDRAMVELQAKGLKFNPRLMLIQDADVPAMWYHRLKKEWTSARSEGRAFVNPVPETTLRWRS